MPIPPELMKKANDKIKQQGGSITQNDLQKYNAQSILYNATRDITYVLAKGDQHFEKEAESTMIRFIQDNILNNYYDKSTDVLRRAFNGEYTYAHLRNKFVKYMEEHGFNVEIKTPSDMGFGQKSSLTISRSP